VAAILGDPEALIAEIRRRAHQRAVEIEEQARKQAAGIQEQAKEESEVIRRQFEQETETNLAALGRRSAAQGELEAQRHFALLREAPIERVWAEAESRLRNLVQQPSYGDILKRLAVRASRTLGASELAIAADPAGHALLSPDTLRQWSAEAKVTFRRSPEPAPAWGGLAATSGRARSDATFPSQLALARVILREKVFEILSRDQH
jgi:vacuolar-type H+-ATPase subunit E/Vma4